MVFVYTYKGHLFGQLNVGEPQGECVDKEGAVWITDTSSSRLVKYAHGATEPTATLQDPGEQPVGCAVNPASGDLAVANICTSPQCANGDIVIYKHAKGKPNSYTGPTIDNYYECAFGSNGSLLVDGKNDGDKPSKHEVRFEELLPQSHTLKSLKVDQSLKADQNIQWTDGNYAVEGFPRHQSVIYQGQIVGREIKMKGVTNLQGGSPIDFFVNGGQIVTLSVASILSFSTYPSGEMIRSFALDWFVKEPEFLVVSRSP
jgi:hypothetical protein